MALIGISGRIGSGKDEIGKIIRYLTLPEHEIADYNTFITEYNNDIWDTNWVIKKFADSLKDIICLLIGCTRKQLEDTHFKNSVLGEEWWYYKDLGNMRSYLEFKHFNYTTLELVKPTPRLLLQLLGTECGRNIIHPNIWVNALFSKYESYIGYADGYYSNTCGKCKKTFLGDKRAVRCRECAIIYPNWIITDVRFPNEIQAVKDKNGISIRVNRNKLAQITGNKNIIDLSPIKIEHESETALDNAEFDYVINNDDSIEELIGKVSVILKKENII